MAQNITEDSSFNISGKVLIAIAIAFSAAVGMFFKLDSEIQIAKTLPEPLDPVITRMEFDMKDQLIRQTIMSTQEDVGEIKDDIKLIKQKLYE
tara:strand:+ start:420 stop:698 length:279 start_codon:yes stop_codon:yes gene_type:complete